MVSMLIRAVCRNCAIQSSESVVGGHQGHGIGRGRANKQRNSKLSVGVDFSVAIFATTRFAWMPSETSKSWTGDIAFGALYGHGQPMRRLIESST